MKSEYLFDSLIKEAVRLSSENINPLSRYKLINSTAVFKSIFIRYRTGIAIISAAINGEVKKRRGKYLDPEILRFPPSMISSIDTEITASEKFG
jgi:hypothetical protein